MFAYDAATAYADAGTPLVVLGGKEYGTGSSRDWAAKGTRLLGVRAVLAESFERIHRSNLVGMGVLPLVFKPGEGWRQLGLDGSETFFIEGIRDIQPRRSLPVRAVREDGSQIRFEAVWPPRHRGRRGLFPEWRDIALCAAAAVGRMMRCEKRGEFRCGRPRR